jgi:hypothetical protein
MNLIHHLYRFIAIFMAALVFITSVGMNVDLHYCGGQLKNINIVGKAASCHKNALAECPFHKKMIAENGKTGFTTKSCCSNKTIYLQSDLTQDIESVDFVISLKSQQFFVAFVTTFLTQRLVKSIPSSYAEYKAPHISRDIYVLIQTFLI